MRLAAVLLAATLAVGCADPNRPCPIFCVGDLDQGGGGTLEDPTKPHFAFWTSTPLGDGDISVARIARGGRGRARLTTTNVARITSVSGVAPMTVEPVAGDEYEIANPIALQQSAVITAVTTDGQAVRGGALVFADPVAAVHVLPVLDYAYAGAHVGYAGATTTTVRLLDGYGDRLVDTSLQLGLATSPGIKQPAWDQVHVPASPGVYRLVIVGASLGTRDVEVTVVDAIDRFEMVRADAETACFHAYRGALEIYAPAWEFRLDLVPRPAASERNCVQLPRDATGTLEVTALGRTQQIALR